MTAREPDRFLPLPCARFSIRNQIFMCERRRNTSCIRRWLNGEEVQIAIITVCVAMESLSCVLPFLSTLFHLSAWNLVSRLTSPIKRKMLFVQCAGALLFHYKFIIIIVVVVMCNCRGQTIERDRCCTPGGQAWIRNNRNDVNINLNHRVNTHTYLIAAIKRNRPSRAAADAMPSNRCTANVLPREYFSVFCRESRAISSLLIDKVNYFMHFMQSTFSLFKCNQINVSLLSLDFSDRNSIPRSMCRCLN